MKLKKILILLIIVNFIIFFPTEFAFILIVFISGIVISIILLIIYIVVYNVIHDESVDTVEDIKEFWKFMITDPLVSFWNYLLK